MGITYSGIVLQFLRSREFKQVSLILQNFENEFCTRIQNHPIRTTKYWREFKNKLWNTKLRNLHFCRSGITFGIIWANILIN